MTRTGLCGRWWHTHDLPDATPNVTVDPASPRSGDRPGAARMSMPPFLLCKATGMPAAARLLRRGGKAYGVARVETYARPGVKARTPARPVVRAAGRTRQRPRAPSVQPEHGLSRVCLRKDGRCSDEKSPEQSPKTLLLLRLLITGGAQGAATWPSPSTAAQAVTFTGEGVNLVEAGSSKRSCERHNASSTI